MGFPEEPQTGTDGTPRRSRRDRQPPADSGFFTPAQQGADGQPPTGGFPPAGDAFAPRQQGPSGPFGAGDRGAAGPRGPSDPLAGPPTGPLGAPIPLATGPQGPPRNPSDPFATGPSDAFMPSNRKPPPGAPQPTEAFTTANAQQPPAGPPADAPLPGGDEPKDAGRGRRGRSKAAKATKTDKADQADSPDKPEQTEKVTPRTWSPYDEGPRSRGPLWASLAGLGVLALLGGGLAVMFNADDPAAVSSTAQRTSAPLPSAPPGEFGYAGSRSTDPDPLTLKELFGSKKITASGRSYEMTVTSKDKKCGDGVLGEKITKALTSAKCTQMMRASFRDKKGEIIGTVGVANLSTTKNAARVAKSGDKSNYVKPLAGKDEVTKFLGSGSGGAKVWTHGHYAVLVWFQNKDGSEPDKNASKRLFQAADDVTKATVFKALDVRTLTGARAA
ncbi:hypothetical protein OUY22_13675 [Nonomuraea sp. MCN248]|uniref:Uncharacterized protein n=1 Tax=Nonomuraea corallina TaxID=2989783 RepID=A0ABT4SB81_9ACTN|nr:hypothetical protein [Nonomuraea corallina]MDA0634469.1 hypothetical protein [Nonomuraea corallina]